MEEYLWNEYGMYVDQDIEEWRATENNEKVVLFKLKWCV